MEGLQSSVVLLRVPAAPGGCVCRMKAPDDDGAWQTRCRRVVLLRRANFKSVYRASDKQPSKRASMLDTKSDVADVAYEFDMDQKLRFL